MALPSTKRELARLHLDWSPVDEPASTTRTALASLAALVIALAANAGLVRLATTASPSLSTYAHFRFVDYGSLTALGVVGACAAWFVVCRITSSPRWFFVRLAVVVSVVLLIPDVGLVLGNQPVDAVLTLMAMHVVMAFVTYNVMVRGAPVQSRTVVPLDVPGPALAAAASALDGVDCVGARFDAGFGPRTWRVMMIAVGVEFIVGIGELFFVPFNRPNGYLPHAGEAISLVHALVGGFLGIGATAIVLLVTREDRDARIAAVGGFIGVVVGAVGGTIYYYHSLRLPGLGLMFIGAAVAFFAYLTPLIANPTHDPTSRPSRAPEVPTSE